MRRWYDRSVDYVLEAAVGDKSPKNQKKQIAKITRKAGKAPATSVVTTDRPATAKH